MNADQVTDRLAKTSAARDTAVILCDARTYGWTYVGHRTGLTLAYDSREGTFRLV